MSGDLFGSMACSDGLRSSRLRLEMVPSDSMEPTLRSQWDHVLVQPCTAYRGEGLYLLQTPFGGWKLTRASSTLNGKGQLLLYVDNKRYGEHLVSIDWFNENVLGIVVADIKIRDHRVLQPSGTPEVRP
ncbi:hypothetical protein [Ancylobacter sp. SL191]|uniref:hypothetical protein n=1 Tax=Ancylobacter sp. SL191 TaxID=2995166 RepID=UPI00226EDD31|nr:hypothetical protein [Ancylobacter sp. SL191]WAC27508.1 hypothetical protein OU996_21340 [Ancylobacter sp. SL191]